MCLYCRACVLESVGSSVWKGSVIVEKEVSLLDLGIGKLARKGHGY